MNDDIRSAIDRLLSAEEERSHADAARNRAVLLRDRGLDLDVHRRHLAGLGLNWRDEQ